LSSEDTLGLSEFFIEEHENSVIKKINRYLQDAIMFN
jgi:hypothetical protein